MFLFDSLPSSPPHLLLFYLIPFVYLNNVLMFQSTMRTIMYTERENQVYSHNNFFLCGKPASYYSPDLFESVCAVIIRPGEHILISIEDNDILYTYNGQCCCGGCVSKTSNRMLTVEVINFHTKEIVYMPKKSSLTVLLTHEYIKHKLCIASMNEICDKRYSGDNDDEYDETDVTVLGNWKHSICCCMIIIEHNHYLHHHHHFPFYVHHHHHHHNYHHHHHHHQLQQH